MEELLMKYGYISELKSSPSVSEQTLEHSNIPCVTNGAYIHTFQGITKIINLKKVKSISITHIEGEKLLEFDVGTKTIICSIEYETNDKSWVDELISKILSEL